MNKSVALVACLLAFFTAVSHADEVTQRISENLKQIDARINVKSVTAAPMEGMHEVTLSSGEVLYADDAGEYFLIGQLYRFTAEQGFVNLSEEKRKLARRERVVAIPDNETVVFAPEGEVKATVSVFTDVDCPYCRKLHQEVPKLNEMGVKVRYLAFPRKGVGTTTYNSMVSIWCAEGEARKTALTEAKSGTELAAADCENPVESQFHLGQDVGVTGTPALVLEDGTLVPGYMPAQRLAKMLGLE